jgi:hypothetical protein
MHFLFCVLRSVMGLIFIAMMIVIIPSSNPSCSSLADEGSGRLMLSLAMMIWLY